MPTGTVGKPDPSGGRADPDPDTQGEVRGLSRNADGLGEWTGSRIFHEVWSYD